MLSWISKMVTDLDSIILNLLWIHDPNHFSTTAIGTTDHKGSQEEGTIWFKHGEKAELNI